MRFYNTYNVEIMSESTDGIVTVTPPSGLKVMGLNPVAYKILCAILVGTLKLRKKTTKENRHVVPKVPRFR